jgi:hypothetical protein
MIYATFGECSREQAVSGGPGFLDRIFPSLSGFLRFRLPVRLAANQSTRYPGFYRQAQNGAGVGYRT